MKYDKAPNDIRLDKFLSVVDNRGDRVMIIKPATLDKIVIFLDQKVGGRPP